MSEIEKNYHAMVDYYTEHYIDQNVLEIIQKENSETVLVNAASYFLHPKKGGNEIQNKILDNLMSSIGKKYPEDTGRFLCMKNEFPCESKVNTTKRLDIMIEFEKYCIAIEAKVNSKLNNPLKEYSEAISDRTNGRELTKLVLVKQDNFNDAKNYLKEEKIEDWGIISWTELLLEMENYIKDNNEKPSISDPYKNLIESLIKIEESPNGLENVEENLRLDLEKKLKRLQRNISTLFRKEEYDIYEWSGHKQLREVVEPRLVLENKNNLFKIDVCVGIRGLQFVIFKKNGYSSELFKSMCKEYPFYYWQDYLDNYELFNRFVICKGDSKGPQFPQNPDDDESILGIESVKRKDTVLVKYDDNDEWLDLAHDKLKGIKKYLEAKLK